MVEQNRPPPTRYAQSGELGIAYHTLGTGPPDIVVAPGDTSHLEFEYGWPNLVRFYQSFAAFGRLIRFDKRGTGMSDRTAGIATAEERMDDIRAVMDAAGSQRAVLVGISESGPLSILFACTYPERVQALVVYGGLGLPMADRTTQEWDSFSERLYKTWGTTEAARTALSVLAPSAVNDPVVIEFCAEWERLSASPGAYIQLMKMNRRIDIRPVLNAVNVPTLILHRRDDRLLGLEHAHYLAQQIPGAKLVELEGDDHVPWVGDSDAIVDEIEEFVTGIRGSGGRHRVLATVLVTDIVGSTERVTELGDRRWSNLLADHNALVRRQLDRFRGREIDTAGDGFLAAFDGPARAVRCALKVVDSARDLGLEIRAGLHTGECELLGDKLAGIAVHTAARIAATANPSEVVVSSTVKDLVAGSGLRFRDRGTRQLKGISEEWHLFTVAADSAESP